MHEYEIHIHIFFRLMALTFVSLQNKHATHSISCLVCANRNTLIGIEMNQFHKICVSFRFNLNLKNEEAKNKKQKKMKVFPYTHGHWTIRDGDR